MQGRDASISRGAALLANGAVLALLAFFGALAELDPDRFYQAVQEDEWLEWATVAGFALAGAAFAIAAWERRRVWPPPWFPAGVALFCLAVAGEEISWGQRLLGYRPPGYFLAHNFQQELNVHNVIETSLRLVAMRAVIGGYGIALPLVARLTPLGGWLARLGVLAPPIALVPAFAATLALHLAYPWSFSDEIVEATLGLCFLGAGLAAAGIAAAPRRRPALATALAAASVMLLGGAGAAYSRHQRTESPATIEAANAELAALAADLLARAADERGRLPTPCGLHKRVYTYVRDYAAGFLAEGAFAGLAERGLPEERAAFFLDPWNSPYWIRDHCDPERGERIVFVYSFGPDRRRSSSERAVGGDDLAHFVRRVRGRGAPSGVERPPDESRERPR